MSTNPNDEAARRAYWTEQMEAGYAIVEKLIAFPVNECGERFASLRDAAAVGGVEMLFSTSKIAGELDRVYFMRESLVRDVVTIGREMNERGWILKIEDCFRTLDMQRQLVRKPSVFDTVLKKTMWELGGQIPTPEMMFRRAIVLTANMPKIGAHMSGSAIDISVFHRDDGTEVLRDLIEHDHVCICICICIGDRCAHRVTSSVRYRSTSTARPARIHPMPTAATAHEGAPG